MIDRVIDAVNQIEGAFSLVIMHKNGLIAIRDPRGIRPLSLGVNNESSIAIASESCALILLALNLTEILSQERWLKLMMVG